MTEVTLRLPTLQRFFRVRSQIRFQSILRCLEYERLAEMGLEGLVLDFGGGRLTNYAKHIVEWGSPETGYLYESANIDPNTQPTYLLDQTCKCPVDDGHYDAVTSLNTMEHVFDLDLSLAELRRVLREGGRLILSVPFIFRVHGHPDDYHRGTPSFWSMILHRHGFDHIEFEALNWGPFSTAGTISGMPGPFKSIRWTTALLLDLYLAWRRYPNRPSLTVAQDAPLVNAPIAYLIQARAMKIS